MSPFHLVFCPRCFKAMSLVRILIQQGFNNFWEYLGGQALVLVVTGCCLLVDGTQSPIIANHSNHPNDRHSQIIEDLSGLFWQGLELNNIQDRTAETATNDTKMGWKCESNREKRKCNSLILTVTWPPLQFMKRQVLQSRGPYHWAKSLHPLLTKWGTGLGY